MNGNKKPSWITGLELGSQLFHLAVAELDEQGRPVVRTVQSVPAQGIERGVLSDPIECSDGVARLVRQAEKAIGGKIAKSLAAVSGSHLKSYNANAAIPIPDPTIGITSRDVERAITTCRTLSLDYDRQILHAFERGFTVNGQEGIKDPVGLFGTKLTVDLHLVTAQNLAVQSITRVLNRAGLEVEGMVLPGLAAAEAVLSDLDQDIGVTLVRIGDTQTEVLLFVEGTVRDTFLFSWGANHMTEFLSRVLKIPSAAAEQLFEQVRTLEERPGRTLRVQSGNVSRNFAEEEVSRLVAGRTKEFFNRLRRRLDESNYFRESSAGVVIVGNMSRNEGFLEMAESLLNMPVRLGTPREVQLDPQVTINNSYITVLGLLRYGMKRRVSAESRSKQTIPVLRWLERTRQVIEEYF